jgi:hypothetical protein
MCSVLARHRELKSRLSIQAGVKVLFASRPGCRGVRYKPGGETIANVDVGGGLLIGKQCPIIRKESHIHPSRFIKYRTRIKNQLPRCVCQGTLDLGFPSPDFSRKTVT